MDLIDSFIKELVKQKNSSTVFNPYRNRDLVDNLLIYLQVMTRLSGKRVLLVGEAPGYRGCRITGIPFTSGQVFQRFKHPVLSEIGRQVKLSKIESENTATIMWEYLSKKEITPLFWNSFPYHPHPPGNDQKNRAPNAAEVSQGIGHLKSLYSIYQPGIVAGIGNKGVVCAKKAFPDKSIVYIRHPSYGGKADFIEGMEQIL